MPSRSKCTSSSSRSNASTESPSRLGSEQPISEIEEVFGKPISIYTRAQAIEDGTLVAVDNETRKEAGFKWPLALTAAAWAEAVAVPKGCEGFQDVPGRLWDVLWMLTVAAKRALGASNELLFVVHVVRSRRHLWRTPPLLKLKAMCGPGDEGEPVVTIMLPDEN